jgi:hypothetical protein
MMENLFGRPRPPVEGWEEMGWSFSSLPSKSRYEPVTINCMSAHAMTVSYGETIQKKMTT